MPRADRRVAFTDGALSSVQAMRETQSSAKATPKKHRDKVEDAHLQNGHLSSISPNGARSPYDAELVDLKNALADRENGFQAKHGRFPTLQDINEDQEWSRLQARMVSKDKFYSVSSLVTPFLPDEEGCKVLQASTDAIERKFRECATEDESSIALNKSVDRRLKASASKSYFLTSEGLRKVCVHAFPPASGTVLLLSCIACLLLYSNATVDMCPRA